MEKVKLTAKQAKEITCTSGKEKLKNQLFKNIRQAAERGETHFIWNFRNCEEFYSDVTNELEKLGYDFSFVGDQLDTIIDIDWYRAKTIRELAIENFKNTESACVPSILEDLKKTVRMDGLNYLVRIVYTSIRESAKRGKNRVRIDISDVSKEVINTISKMLETEGFAVTQDSFFKLLIITF